MIKKHIYFVIALILISCSSDSEFPVIKYVNGNIFSDSGFINKDFYTIGNEISFKKTSYDTIVNLENQFVIPPFGDAHTHNFDDPEKFDTIYNAYLNEGTFYVQVLTNHFSNYLKIKDSLKKYDKIDVKFTHGGITSTGGHPHASYETQALNLSWRAMLDPEKRAELKKSKIKENDAYYLIDSIDQFENKWKEIIAKQPDLLKIYMSDMLSRDQHISNGNVGIYGITKEVAAAILNRAKEENIEVYVHIETVDDFEMAIDLGAKNFAHMPGYGGGIGNQNYEELTIPDNILDKAVKNNVTIVPTVSFAKYYSNSWDGTKMSLDTSLMQSKYAFLKEQLARFDQAGINLAFGADQANTTLSEEIEDLITIEAFDNKRLLELLINSSSTIFPERKIGAIKEGYEASFLVLKTNPIESINAIKGIKIRVKNGEILNQ